MLISVGAAVSLSIRMSVPHWRDFRARLVKQQQVTAPSQPLQEQLQLWPGKAGGKDWWVHELAVPEKGCVLLAQPHAVFVEQPHLNRGAVRANSFFQSGCPYIEYTYPRTGTVQ